MSETKKKPRSLFPRASVRREPDGRLAISVSYSVPVGQSCYYIGPGESHFDVPFSEWEKHIGKLADLSQWHGIGPGMIGGSSVYKIAGIMSEKLEWGLYENMADAQRVLADLSLQLQDPLIEHVDFARIQMADILRGVRLYLRRHGATVVGSRSQVKG